MLDFGAPDILLAEFERISEWKAANRTLLQELADTSSNGAVARAVAAAVLQLRDLTAGASPVDTGTLRASHRGDVTVEGGDVVGRVFIDPYTINPVYGGRPELYGEIWAGRYFNWFDQVAEASGDAVMATVEDNIMALFEEAFR